jgi:hypothetical protein
MGTVPSLVLNRLVRYKRARDDIAAREVGVLQVKPGVENSQKGISSSSVVVSWSLF